MFKRAFTALCLLTAVLVAAAWRQPQSIPFGFTSASARAFASLERKFLELPSTERIRDANLYLAEKPHVAGSPRDRELAEWTRDRFKEYGLDDVQITTVASGADALRLMRSHPYDCVVLDLKLPDMSGFDLLTEMQSEERLRDTPVVVFDTRLPLSVARVTVPASRFTNVEPLIAVTP